MHLIFNNIFLCKINIFLHLCFAFKVCDMQKDKTMENEQFWNRMDFLIGDERPYAWAEAKGINRSAFQSAKTRKTKPLPKTVKDWAEKIGCSYQWLNMGEGEPFSKDIGVAQQQDKEIYTEPSIVEQEGLKITTAIDKAMLQAALETTEKKLKEQSLIMQPKDKAEFILMLYDILIDIEKSPYNKQLLNDVIFEVEECLERLYRTMLVDKKTLLIVAIYTLYSVNSENKEGIKPTITDIIRRAA